MVDVRIAEKYMLSLEEADAYFRIGVKKIAALAHENPEADWLFMNGNRIQIKREKFEKLLDSISTI